MAWSFADLSSDYQAWLAADYPMLVVQALPVLPPYALWVRDADIASGNITTWADRSATAAPAYYAYDGEPGLKTYHSGAVTDDVWHYVVDAGKEISIDCAMLIGGNWATLALTEIRLSIADDNAFSTSLTTVTDFGGSVPAADARMVSLELGHDADGGRTHDTGADAGPNLYTARYFMFTFDKTGTNIVPEVGELVLGRRYQCKTPPMNPWDKNVGLHDEISRVRTAGGVTRSTVYFENQYVLGATFPAWEDARVADFKEWFKASRGVFYWFAEPSSAPDEWRMITKPTDLSAPSAEWTERSLRISGEEQGPEEYFLENEP